MSEEQESRAMETFGGYTLAQIDELVSLSMECAESIDDMTGDGATSALIIRDLVDALRDKEQAE